MWRLKEEMVEEDDLGVNVTDRLFKPGSAIAAGAPADVIYHDWISLVPSPSVMNIW